MDIITLDDDRMAVLRNIVTTLALLGLVLPACSDAPVVSGGSTDQTSVTEPAESNSDTTGPASMCAYGVSGGGVIDYAPPSPGATQTREQALSAFNGSPSKHDFVLQSEGWATQTDAAGNIIRVATFEQLEKNYYVVGTTINCAEP